MARSISVTVHMYLGVPRMKRTTENTPVFLAIYRHGALNVHIVQYSTTRI
jgi:hypothetical protein